MAQQRRKMVDGATLHRRGDFQWIGRIGGSDIIFTATVGRYNGKVNGWRARSVAIHPTTDISQRPVFSTSGASLKRCVNDAQDFFGAKGAAHPNFNIF